MAHRFVDDERAEAIRRRVRQLCESLPHSVLSTIGGTQLVRLSRKVSPYEAVPIYLKLEAQNGSGSVKDRMTLYLIADAIERGLLKKDTVIVEASSGNTGISLAMLGAVLGYKVLITIADNVSVERYKILRMYGAELDLTPGAKGTCGAIERAMELGEKPGHLWIAQHFNPVNSFAHYETTGREIIEQVRALGATSLDAIVVSSGTTGTLMGISARAREELPKTKIVAVWPRDTVMGIRRPEGDARPVIFDDSLIDSVVDVKNEDALNMAKTVARCDGLLFGPSGGATVIGALATAEQISRGGRAGLVLALIPDSGERYLSLLDPR